HEITGFSQQQGTGQDVSFSSQHGRIALSTLRMVSDEAEPRRSHPVEKREENELRINKTSAAARPEFESDDVIRKIERLGELHAKGILTDDEFATKKAELLSRI
ncbi:SHOCT domain-containing protein, partial [Rhizobium leguminosarum]